MVKNDPLSLWRASADRQLMVQEGHVMAKNDHSWLLEDTSWLKTTTHGGKQTAAITPISALAFRSDLTAKS